MKRVIIVGSPRTNGRSAHLAEMLFEANIDERPQDELFLVPISEIEVGPCIGCGACRKQSPVIFKDDDGNEVSELRYRCVFDDDMQTLYDLLDEADALTIVTPVYFSGAPAPMKCVLDRLQPYFWPYLANGPRLPKRPLELHVIGEGGDPHGFDPLVGEVRSATLLAGFEIERIYNWVGKISADGEILEEATVLQMPEKPGGAHAEASAESAGSTSGSELDSGEDAFDAQNAADADAKNASVVLNVSETPDQRRAKLPQGKPRPKLDFSKSAKGSASRTQDRKSAEAESSARRAKPSSKSESKARGEGHDKGKGKSLGKSGNRGAGFGRGNAVGGTGDGRGNAKGNAGAGRGNAKGVAGDGRGYARGGTKAASRTSSRNRGKGGSRG